MADRKFRNLGVLLGQKARKRFFVTTSGFTKEAVEGLIHVPGLEPVGFGVPTFVIDYFMNINTRDPDQLPKS